MKASVSGFYREAMMNGIEEDEYDVLIIGGGITGAGIALDAASRGMRTILIEMQDFAAGTSSRSTKLIHGGLRYLKQGEIKMVAKVGKERAIVYENGPHVTKPEWMLLPIYRDGTLGKWSTSMGLMAYDFLAGVKRKESRRMLGKEETLRLVPFLRKDQLLGSGYYVEYRTDDARLTIEVLKEAVHQGATAINYMRMEQFVFRSGKVKGVRAVDQLKDKSYRIVAKEIVNATGPWVEELQMKDQSQNQKKLRLTKGTHLVFDQTSFPLNQAMYFDTRDKRMMFAIPRDKKVYVGTTDTDYEGDLVHPIVTRQDCQYVLDAISFQFPGLNIGEHHVESSWSGLRPLIYERGRNPSEISRKDEVWISDSGLISIAGGKLTGYRAMAEKVVNIVARSLARHSFSLCGTKHMAISGGHVGGSTWFPLFIEAKVREGMELGFAAEQAKWLVRFYGSNIDHVYALVPEYKEEYQLPLDLFVSILYSLREEMVMKPADYFIRRTGALFFNIEWVHRWKRVAIDFMADKLAWTTEQKSLYTQELEKHLFDANPLG